MSDQKKQKNKKWYEVNGYTFGILFAKNVRSLTKVCFNRERYYFVIYSDVTPHVLQFKTESEANIARNELEAWIKCIQGE